MRTRSWKPVRRGDVFCAPACGRGCTIQEHDAAQAKGDALAKCLGAGWTVRVHENLGWHVTVLSPSGRVKLIGDPGHYTAFLGEPGQVGGRFAEQGATPEAAIGAVMRIAVSYLRELEQLVAGVGADATIAPTGRPPRATADSGAAS